MENVMYRAASYSRLSKDDGDGSESNSITNQKELIRDYLKNMPDIEICMELYDDGYSGVNFDRPYFQEMMEAVKAGEINCIVVKDLSRFGRNYIETGKYLEKIFPFLGVRFIVINDNIDSIRVQTLSEQLIIPFKNLINDTYCRDISIKIRSQFEVKRKKGDFVGSFAVYGFLKSAENKNKLIVDEYASSVVKEIFSMKLDGMSPQGIADYLNNMGVLSPLEYKKSIGLNYTTVFKEHIKAKWSAVAVTLILKNEVYLGVLVQNKVGTPNYKIKQRVKKPKEEWIRCENSHEAIISSEDFQTVNRLLLTDTRKSPDKDNLYLFSGILKCGDCKHNMVRRPITNNGITYDYYICSTHKRGGGCASHRINERKIEDTVLALIKAYVRQALDMEEMSAYIENLPLNQEKIKNANKLLLTKREEVEKYKNLKASLYDKMVDGIVNKTDFMEFKKIYTRMIDEAEDAALKIEESINEMLHNTGETHEWIKSFKQYSNIAQLTRKIVVTLIDKIYVHNNGSLEILFKYQQDFDKALHYFNSVCTAENLPVLEREVI